MNIKKIACVLFFLTILGATTLGNIRPVFSQGTRLYISPAIIYKPQNEFFTANITVSAVDFLYDWQANLTFNPAVLRVFNITEGDFLQRQPEGTVGAKRIEASWALFGWTTKGVYIGESGSGTLATVRFEVLSKGESMLAFDRNPERTYLDAQTSPTQPANFEPIDFTMQDAVFTNRNTPPIADFTYSPLVPRQNEQITFNASSSSATAPLEISEYIWHFGDGTNATVSTPTISHTYTIGGVFTVTLTVVDNATASDLVESVFSTTGMPLIWYEVYSTKTVVLGVSLPHDVAVTGVTTSTEEATAGDTVTITVTAMNTGTEAESFSVTAYYASNSISTQQITNLASGEQKQLTFNWDTTGVAEGDYRIKAVASTVTGETNLQNNEFIDGTVKVKAGAQLPITLIIGVVAVAVLIVVLVAVILLRRRKP